MNQKRAIAALALEQGRRPVEAIAKKTGFGDRERMRRAAAGRGLDVDEVVRVLPVVVSDVKRFFPGAAVQRTVRRDPAFAGDWLTSLPLIDDPTPDLLPHDTDVEAA